MVDSMSQSATELRAVRIWLVIVAVLIVAMVLVGGATRLTESGLSIVEWKLVTGTIPPVTADQWTDTFEAYKKIPQYHELNRGMSLDEFKTIFWWEWGHRLLGRMIGVVYLLPFLWFLWQGVLPANLKQRLWLIFGLGALQGAVGWWMVASGLSGRIDVSQYRLATHLILALVIFSAIVWILRRLEHDPKKWVPVSRKRSCSIKKIEPRFDLVGAEKALEVSISFVGLRRLRITSVILVALVFIQLYFGALVAGLHAGRVFNTWPLIDNAIVPSFGRLFFEEPWWRNFFDNTLMVQFSHRMLAYVIWIVAVLHVVDAVRSRMAPAAINGALWLASIITFQVVLGILTILHMVPIGLALAHQGCAILVLTLALFQAERLMHA